MKIINDINIAETNRTVVTIGTFDGVHLGHRKVLERVIQIANEIDGESLVFTFDPHPRMVLASDYSSLRLLTSLDEKCEQIALSGIENLVVYNFTKEFAALPYNQFVREILVEKLHLHTLVVGHDHRLGHNREGSFSSLKALSKELNFAIEQIDPLIFDEVDISSTKIRNALAAGNLDIATHYLGYPYQLCGKVIEGNKLGRKLGFPTANIEIDEPSKLIPGVGVYAVTIRKGAQKFNGMLNIGFRPTLVSNPDHLSIEVNIFGLNEDLYGQTISVEFRARIRDEKKFDSLDALTLQLANDKIEVEAFFAKK